MHRRRAIEALEQQGRPWRIAFVTPNLQGLEDAVASGLGISVLQQRQLTADDRILERRDGLPALQPTELALRLTRSAGDAARDLAQRVGSVFDEAHSGAFGRQAAPG